MVLVVFLFACFAGYFTIEKTALQYAAPFFLVGSRMFFAGCGLLLIQAIKNHHALKLSNDGLKAILLLSLCSIYLTNISEIWGLDHMTSSKACLLYSLSPFIAAFVAFILLREKLSKRKLIGLAIGFVGLWPILYTQTETEIISGQIFFLSFAEISVMFAVFASVCGWVFLKKAIQQHRLTLLTANGYSMLIGGILALLHSYLAHEAWQPLPVSDVQTWFGYLVILSLVSNVICYNLYGYLLKRYSATFMSFAGLITPLFATAFGWYFLHEQITWHFFASLALFSVGLSIFYLEETREPAQTTATWSYR